MGVREIEVFRVVMNAGSTSKAANMLGISQPAVSQAIRKLETAAGIAFSTGSAGVWCPRRKRTR